MMQSPTMPTAIRHSFDSFMEDVHTCLPAKIETYDYETSKASVKPLIKKEWKDGTFGELPVIVNVPVVWPRVASGILHFPLKKGDGVVLHFSERSLDTWLSKGGDTGPGNPRKFDLSDAIAVPGLYPFTENSPAPDNDNLYLIFKDSKITIKANGDIIVDGPNMKLGSSAINALVNETFLAIFDAHTHMYAPGPGTPIPTATPLPVSTPANQTSKTKAE